MTNRNTNTMISRCETCRRPLPPAKRGRPRMFCPAPDGAKRSQCKQFADARAMLATAIDSIKFTDAAAAQLRGEVWGMANDIKPWIDMAARERFAQALINGRASKGWTQRQLAEACDVPRKLVSRLERCKSEPTREIRQLLLGALA